MNTEKMKQFILDLADLLKTYETEILAYRTVFKALQLSGELLGLDAALQEAHLVAAQETEKKYVAELEPIVQRLTEATLDQALLQLLQDWRPKGKAH